MQKFDEIGDFDAFHVGKFGSSQGLQKCGRRYTLDTFRKKRVLKSRFFKSPEGSKSMAGVAKVIIRVNAPTRRAPLKVWQALYLRHICGRTFLHRFFTFFVNPHRAQFYPDNVKRGSAVHPF